MVGEGLGGDDFEGLSFEAEGGADGEAVIEGLP